MIPYHTTISYHTIPYRTNTIDIYYNLICFQYAYNYSLIDGSILDDDTVTFDTDVALKYLYFILGSIGLMVIIGVTFDVCNLWRISGEVKKEDSAGTVCFHCSTLPQILNAKVHMYTSKNAQTINTSLSSNCQQIAFALLVPILL